MTGAPVATMVCAVPNTGDATGTFDPAQAAQTIYRAFQDNGVPILGLCKTTISPGPPPTVHVDINLQDGVPVATDPNALPEGESLPPSNGSLSIDLTQFNNSVGGSSWVASGTVTRSNGDTGTATSTPGTGGLTSQDLNDPAKADQWNQSLPQDAYEAIERVKRKLGIHGGRVATAVPRNRPLARFPRVPVVVGGVVLGLLLGLGIGTAVNSVQAKAQSPSQATAPKPSHAPSAAPLPKADTVQLNLQGDVAMTARPPICAGWPASGTYKLAVKADTGKFSMSIDGADQAVGTVDGAGNVTAANQFYKVTGQLLPHSAAVAAAPVQLVDGTYIWTFRFAISYLDVNGMCNYDATSSFGAPATSPSPSASAQPSATPSAAPGSTTTSSQGGLPPVDWALAILLSFVFGGAAWYFGDPEDYFPDFPLFDAPAGYVAPPPMDLPATPEGVVPIQGDSHPPQDDNM